MPRQVHIVSRVSYDNIGEMTSLLLRHLFLRTCQSTRHRHFKTVDLFVSKETLLNSFFSWFYNILTQVHSANKWLVNVILLFLCYSFNREKKTFIFLFTVKHLTRVKRQTFCFFFFSLACYQLNLSIILTPMSSHSKISFLLDGRENSRPFTQEFGHRWMTDNPSVLTSFPLDTLLLFLSLPLLGKLWMLTSLSGVETNFMR